MRTLALLTLLSALVAPAAGAQAIPVRLDFRALLCLQRTGEGHHGPFSSSDEPFVVAVVGRMGRNPAGTAYPNGSRDHYSDIDSQEFAFDSDNPLILWQGNLDPGEGVQAVITVMEKDDEGGTPGYIARETARNLAVVGAAWGTQNYPALAAAAVNALIDALGHTFGGGYHDHVGTFAIRVSNIDGELVGEIVGLEKAAIRGTSHPQASAISASGRTVRLRLDSQDDDDDGPQDYRADVNVRDMRTGRAIRWRRQNSTRAVTL